MTGGLPGEPGEFGNPGTKIGGKDPPPVQQFAGGEPIGVVSGKFSPPTVLGVSSRRVERTSSGDGGSVSTIVSVSVTEAVSTGSCEAKAIILPQRARMKFVPSVITSSPAMISTGLLVQ